ncbi:hypothetical protein [Fundidesulfovibrio terrae]|uniref:hypothetical protein n=1 Tax=Fundidesulfovibrio terrae TaxID=2922866 RepID=UPI001FAF35BE|nr:hypothetical protein [Fundidesulfovibrio terrae]
MLSLLLIAGLVLMGDWLVMPQTCDARGGGRGMAAGPRGAVASSPRGSVAVGPRGGVAATGPRGGAAVRGPSGAAAARGPYGGEAVRGPGGAAAARGPYGGAAVRGPAGNVVAAPRGRVVPPPVPVPVPVAPGYGYYGYGPSAGGVAAGMALGAMLTVLPATAIAISGSSHEKVYMVDTKCYQEVMENGKTVYREISCP